MPHVLSLSYTSLKAMNSKVIDLQDERCLDSWVTTGEGHREDWAMNSKWTPLVLSHWHVRVHCCSLVYLDPEVMNFFCEGKIVNISDFAGAKSREAKMRTKWILIIIEKANFPKCDKNICNNIYHM